MKYVEACECHRWHLRIWKKADPSEIREIPFRCRSWRHSGECRLWRGAQDFARCKAAMESLDYWCHITLTYDCQSLKSIQQTYRTGVYLWSMLRKRLIREFGPIQYIQTWERHKSGFPHVHIALSNEELHSRVMYTKAHKRDHEYGYRNFEGILQRHATECFFGPRGWLEKIHTKAAFAGYLQKLARELTGTGKDYQVPENAPRHFRRIRASRKLLPPPYKDPELSGRLLTFALP